MSQKYTFSRRKFLAVSAAAVAAPTLLGGTAWGRPDLKSVPENELTQIADALPKAATVKPKKPRKLLNFYRCDGFIHGSINRGNAAFEMLGKETGAYETVTTADMSAFDPGALDEFDAVMFNNTTRLKFTDAQKESLMGFIKGGKGVCGCHAASDNFYDWPEAAGMMGGLFAGHPWGGGGTWAVQIEEPDHPINAGFDGKGFWVKDEIYKLKEPYSRENLRVLVGLDMTKEVNQRGQRPDNDHAISWIRDFEKGRVFYCSLGHNNHIFWTTSILQHYLDGIQYAFGDIEADATPSAKLEKDVKIVPAPAQPA